MKMKDNKHLQDQKAYFEERRKAFYKITDPVKKSEEGMDSRCITGN